MTPFGMLRDLVLLAVVVAGIVHQEFFRPVPANEMLMFYMAILGGLGFVPNGLADAVRGRNGKNGKVANGEA